MLCWNTLLFFTFDVGRLWWSAFFFLVRLLTLHFNLDSLVVTGGCAGYPVMSFLLEWFVVGCCLRLSLLLLFLDKVGIPVRFCWFLKLCHFTLWTLAYALFLLVGGGRLLLSLTRLLLLFANVSLFLFLFILSVDTSKRVLVWVDGKQVVHELLLNGLAQVFLNKLMQLSAKGVASCVALLTYFREGELAQIFDKFERCHVARNIQYLLQVSVSCVHEQHHQLGLTWVDTLLVE